MNQLFHKDQVNKLTQRLIEIDERKDKIIDAAISKMKSDNLSSITLPNEFSELDKEYWNIEEQLWNARSQNKEIVYLQDIIFSTYEDIRMIDELLNKYAELEKLGITIVYKNAEWQPIDVLKNNKSEAQARIKKCQDRISELKSEL